MHSVSRSGSRGGGLAAPATSAAFDPAPPDAASTAPSDGWPEPQAEQHLVDCRSRATQRVTLRKVSPLWMRLSQRLLGGLVSDLHALAPPWSRLELTPAATATWSADTPASPAVRLVGRYGRIDLADDVLLSVLTGMQCPDDAPPAIRHSLQRMALSRISHPLQERMGGPFQVLAPDQDITSDPEMLVCFLSLIDINGELHSSLLRASQRTLEAWSASALWSPHSRHWQAAPLGRVSLKGGLRLARVALPLPRLRTLRSGDAILIPSKTGGLPEEIHMVLGSNLLKVCYRDANSYAFQGWGSEAPPFSNSSHVKTNEKGPAAMDALKVDLDFVVGRIAMTVSELSTVTPGGILPLEVSSPARVRIVAHGTELGSGELIDVDGRLAVEVVEWGQR